MVRRSFSLITSTLGAIRLTIQLSEIMYVINNQFHLVPFLVLTINFDSFDIIEKHLVK